MFSDDDVHNAKGLFCDEALKFTSSCPHFPSVCFIFFYFPCIIFRQLHNICVLVAFIDDYIFNSNEAYVEKVSRS